MNPTRITKKLKRFYDGRIRDLAEKVGVDEFINRIYTNMMDSAVRIRFLFSNNPYRLSVNNSDVLFRNENFSDYKFNYVGTNYEMPIIEKVVQEVQPGDIFWDVGANFGRYSCIVSKVTPVDEIVAFEPHPENISRLKENLEYNNISNVSIQHYALSDTDGSMTLSGDGLGNISMMKKEGQKSVTADLNRGDAVSKEMGIPNIVKIDVEGAESKVIEGMTSILEHPQCRMIVCELHTETTEPNDIATKLAPHGFSVSRINLGDIGSPYIVAE
jgi:FkbM family methyltransferase